jgi:flagellar basal body rod protein FlgG
MDALTVAAASGMKARTESLEMLANNLANQGSAGYKPDREFYSLYIAEEALDGLGASVLPTPPAVPVIEKHWTDFSQGPLTETGNSLHLALSGAGFFTVQSPQGKLYTRSGNFRLSAAGRLETQEGYPVLADDGNPVALDSQRGVDVSSLGEIRQEGTLVGRLGIVDFAQPQSLTKRNGTYFQLADPGMAPRTAGGATVHQGRLESTNQPPAEAAVRLITVMRQFEMLQKAIQIGAEMSRRADDVARIGN